jgi:hypothetical protein
MQRRCCGVSIRLKRNHMTSYSIGCEPRGNLRATGTHLDAPACLFYSV